MIKRVYPSGTTVRLQCIFKDFDDSPIDPQIVKIILYDYKYDVIEKDASVTKKDIGHYYCDYVTDNKNQTIYFEWYGEIDGLPSILRDGFMTKFML